MRGLACRLGGEALGLPHHLHGKRGAVFGREAGPHGATGKDSGGISQGCAPAKENRQTAAFGQARGGMTGGEAAKQKPWPPWQKQPQAYDQAPPPLYALNQKDAAPILKCT